MSNQLIIIENNQLSQAMPADQNPAALYLSSLQSAQSRRTMKAALETIAGILGGSDIFALPWGALRREQTVIIKNILAQRYKVATANKILSAMRGVLKEARRKHLISLDDYADAIDVRVKGDDKQSSGAAGRALTAGEIAALKGACRKDKTAAGARDETMIGVMYTCGLRRAELVALDVTDYEPETGKLVVRHGKGNKTRTVYAENGAKEALDRWIIERGRGDGAMFPRIGKGNKLTLTRLTTQAVYVILQKRATQAGIEKKFSPHDFRRTFAGDLLDRGADIGTVCQMMGHASVTTTARYDRRGEASKKKAAGLLHF